MNYTSLLERINENKHVDFGETFNNAFELFKKVFAYGLLLVVLQVLFVLPLIAVLYFPLLSMGILESYGDSVYDSSFDFKAVSAGVLILFFIWALAVIFVIQAIAMALNAGFLKICKAADDGEIIDIKLFFTYFKSTYLSKLFVLSIASAGISILALLLCVLPIFYVMVPIYLFAVIFAFNPELSVSEIIKSSFKLGNKKWLVIFGLIMVIAVCVQILAYVTCGLGSLLSFFTMLALYNVYKKAIGFN